MHASTVNLRTGTVSPQFHVVYADWFSTVSSTSEARPENWEDLCISSRFQNFPEEGEDVRLAEVWLEDGEPAARPREERLRHVRPPGSPSGPNDPLTPPARVPSPQVEASPHEWSPPPEEQDNEHFENETSSEEPLVEEAMPPLPLTRTTCFRCQVMASTRFDPSTRYVVLEHQRERAYFI